MSDDNKGLFDKLKKSKNKNSVSKKTLKAIISSITATLAPVLPIILVAGIVAGIITAGINLVTTQNGENNVSSKATENILGDQDKVSIAVDSSGRQIF